MFFFKHFTNMDFHQKAHIIHGLFQIEIRPSQVTFLFVWPKPASCKQTVVGAWATHFKTTLSYPKWYLKSFRNPSFSRSWQPLRFDFRSLGNCTSTRLCRKFRPNLGVIGPGFPGQRTGQGNQHIPPMERTLIFPTLDGRCWVPRGGTTYYLNELAMFRSLLQLLLITSKVFLVDCYVIDEPVPKNGNLYLDWPPYYPPPSPQNDPLPLKQLEFVWKKSSG